MNDKVSRLDMALHRLWNRTEGHNYIGGDISEINETIACGFIYLGEILREVAGASASKTSDHDPEPKVNLPKPPRRA